jgi:mannose/fructose/N-acetylgalactosamine-specific phosphotransferase system component IID
MKKRIFFFLAGLATPFVMGFLTPAIAGLYILMAQKGYLWPWLTFLLIAAFATILLMWKKPHVIERLSPKTTKKEVEALTQGLSMAIGIIAVIFIKCGGIHALSSLF